MARRFFNELCRPPRLEKLAVHISTGASLMQKSLVYTLILAATLGLAACDKASENKAEDARESAQDAQESMNDAVNESNQAAQESAEAARERAKENLEEAPAAPATPPASNP